MAYDEPRFRTRTGLRDETEYRSEVDSDADYPGYGALDEPDAARAGGRGAAGGRPSPGRVDLGDVFDDPAHGDPGRDRMAVHLLWESMLLVGAVCVGLLLYRVQGSAFSGTALRDLMIFTAMVGVLVLAVGLSLRASVPNLAVGVIAYGSAQYFADHAGSGTVPSAAVTVALGAATGAVIAGVVVAFHVPAWAASLGGGLAALVWVERQSAALKIPGYSAGHHGAYWLAGFVALALVGGLIGMVKPIRRTLGRFRSVADPGRRRGAAAAVVAFAAFVVSSALAAGAGVLLAAGAGGAAPADAALGQAGTVSPAHGVLVLTGLALGGALLGGTSILGRRGGLFGSVLAVALIVLVLRYAEASGRHVATLAVAASAIGIGLVVSRLVEAFGRPQAVAGRDEAHWRSESVSGGAASDSGDWSSGRSRWSDPAPESAEERWGAEERWDSEERWGTR